MSRQKLNNEITRNIKACYNGSMIVIRQPHENRVFQYILQTWSVEWKDMKE